MKNVIIFLIGLTGLISQATAQSYEYDNGGRLTRVIYSSGQGVLYSYDSRDNLVALESQTAPAAPTNVRIKRLSNFEAEITWEQVGNVGGFIVQKRVAGAVDWENISEFVIDKDLRKATVDLEQELLGGSALYRVIAVSGEFGAPSSTPSLSVAPTARNARFVRTSIDENDHALGRGMGDSLREVIEASVSGDVIKFDGGDGGGAGLFAPLYDGSRIKLAFGELVINKDLTIDASQHPGGFTIDEEGVAHPFPGGITIDAEGLSRCIRIAPGVTVTLKGVTLTHGTADNGGGLINEGSTVILQECILTGNLALGHGGGLYNEAGDLEVIQCTFSLNAAEAGGALYNDNAGGLEVGFSTFAGNYARNGGGIYNLKGNATIRTSTFTQNDAVVSGGGFLNAEATTLVENCTFNGNTSGENKGAGIANVDLADINNANLTLRHDTISENTGGGVYNESPALLHLDNTIVANNTNLKNSPLDLVGDYTAIGANLVRTHTGARLGGPAPLTDDPLLEPIASYGGATVSMPPLFGSPVIDAGVVTANTPSTDQEAAFRLKGDAPDIGSVESTLSADTDLLWLTSTAGTLTPTFRSIRLDYAASVPGSASTVAVRPASAQSGQTIEVRINGGDYATVASKAASAALVLVPGENAVQVRVTAENGTTTKTYTLKVIRGAPVEADTSLASLSTSSGSLAPAFQPNVFAYDTFVSNNTTSATVTATTAAAGTTLEVRSNLGAYVPMTSDTASPPLALKVGANTIDIRVRAKDGSSTSITSLTVSREALAVANATLAGLSTSAGALTPSFTRGRSVYRLTVTDEVTDATVTAVAAQTGATMKIRANGGAFGTLTSGAASDSITLNPGENIIEVQVTAQDGSTVNPYRLIINRVVAGLAAASGTGNDASMSASISADCRFVAYSSRATNLVVGDNNNKEDVFVFDRMDGSIERVSVDNNGIEGNFDSTRPSISADGRYVAFQSEATNLVPNDTNGDIDRSFGKDIFVYDRETDTIERVSLTDSGGESNQASEAPSISGDGRYVAFVSGANNLVSGYANGEYNVYIHDRTEDTIVGISVPFGNYAANLNSLNPAMSSDGNYVAFEFSVDKSVDSTPGYQYRDIYLYNRVTQGVQRITGTEIGLDADQTESRAPSISADGRYVVFQSNLENLDFYDTNSAVDVFIYDRSDGSIRRVSSNGAEGGENFRESTTPSISGDGRFVAFESQASNLVASDTNGSTDIFLKNLQSGEIVLISLNEAGTQGDADSFLPSVSFDGRCVAFQSNATNLKSNDTNDASDVFVAFTEEQDPSSVTGIQSLASNLGAVRTGEVAYSGGVVEGVDLAFIRPSPADPGASVEARVNAGSFVALPSSGVFSLPLLKGDNTIEIRVTAADGSTTQTSTIAVTRILPSSNAELVSLVTSSGSLSPTLSAATSLYSVTVSNGTSELTVRPTTADGNAVVTVNGIGVVSGANSIPINLDVGSNSVITQVLAEDGVTAKTYALAVTRQFKATDLFSLDPSYGILDPVFTAGTTSYNLVVPYFVSVLGFTPTAAVEGATVTVYGAPVEAGASSSPIGLEAGENTITTVVPAQGGGSTETYSVVVTRSQEPTNIPDSRLSNLSVRTTLATSQILIVGFVMQGGEKEVLVRAAGPAMNDFGLSGLPDPRLELFDSTSTLVTANEDWPSELSVVFTALGAFDFAPDSLDAAFLEGLAGPHTVHVRGVGAGLVLVEAYDAGSGTDLRLVNLSARNRVGTGPDILIAGFVIEGTGSKTVLIRGIGPKLTDFGVGNVLADPLIGIFDASNTRIAENDDWEASLADTFTALGAFDLPVGSKDAALVVTLPAGASYTVKLRGADGGTGQALVEIYEVE